MGTRPWLNYHHLLYFKTIAREGGIAKAAKLLKLGQPTLSTQLKQFEAVIGHQLFDRSKGHLQITEAGRLVLGYATEIFRLGDEMIDALNDQHRTAKIQVQLGATDTVPKQLMLEVYHQAQQAFDCIVSIVEGSGDDLIEQLRGHRVDLVVSNYPPPVTDAVGLFAKSIAKMEVVICGSAKFANLQKGFPQSLADQRFVMPTQQSKLRHDVDHYLKLHAISVNIVAEVQDTALQKLLGLHGDGLIPIALPAAEELIKTLDLVVIGRLQDVYEELWLIAAQRRVENPVAAALMKDFKIYS